MAKPTSLARLQVNGLLDNLREFRLGPVVGDRQRTVINGVTDKGVFIDGMTADRFLGLAGKLLADSGRVFNYGNSIAYETSRDESGSLMTLAIERRAESHAAPVLSNLFVTSHELRTGPVQSLLGPKLAQALLADESLGCGLPTIRYYARRLTFDLDFQLCSPGWNPGAGILVHAPEIVPSPWEGGDAPATAVIDRLPHHLRDLLREFDWRSDADLVNTVGMFLTGVLINHFIDDPHPAWIVDGNQAEIGKTLLVQVLGLVLDASEPERIPLGNEEEVEKRVCAQLRTSTTSLLFFDNVRARIESAFLEQNILSPQLTIRILGRSANLGRPNTYLWMITSNLTAGTPDFISRAVPIRLFYEGNPRTRKFKGNPHAFAARRRQEILGELAGMVLRWVEHGRHAGLQGHRCRKWATVIGGILDIAGLGGHFLTNLAEAEAAMDQGLLDLATLAEHVLAKGVAELQVDSGADPSGKGRPAGSWSDVVAAAGVLREKLAEATNLKARETLIGAFLASKVDRTVPIETAGGPRHATLRKLTGRSRQKLYYFEVSKASSDDDDKGDIKPVPADLPGEDVDITPGAVGDAKIGELPAEAWEPGDEGTPGELSWL